MNSMIRASAIWLLIWTICPALSYAQTFSTELSSPLPTNKSTLRVKESDPDTTPRFHGEWEGETGGEGMDQGKDQGFAAHFGGRIKIDYRLSNMFHFQGTPYASFYSGRLQQRIENDDYESRLGLDDGYLQFTPTKWFELRAGALSQRFLDMPLLVSRGRAFPGVMEMGHIDFDHTTHLDLVAQQTVPTSRSLNTDRDEREKLPTFHTESAHLKFTPLEDFNFTAWGGHYQWTGLPEKVAFYSQLLGNTASGEQASNAHFLYGFNGVFGGLRGCWCRSAGPGLEMSLSRFVNLDAPDGRKNGQLFEVSPMWRTKFWDLKVTGGLFFNERDTTPGYYNPSRFGNNNRVGESLEVKLHLRQYKFSIIGQFIDANTINDDPYQQHLTSMLFGLETDYEAF
jgi:hypothetical protein